MNKTPARASQPGTRRVVVPLLLRVRTKPTFWDTFQTWLRQLWQRWRTPRIVVQPPLQPARHKPFPQRPHHRRRQAVFAALATAPPNATLHELIAHVRSITGTGCSRKLIIAWRQDTARGRQSDAGRGRCSVLGVLLCLGINACATTIMPQPEITISPAPNAVPTISNFPSPISNSLSPRLLQIKLTLNAPHELQVKVGQQIEAGALLSDRALARQRLLVQQRALQSAQQHLHTQRQLTQASRQQLQSLGLDLPLTTFAAEQAAVKRAETEAGAVNRVVEIQRQRVASYESLVSGETDALNSRNPKPETRNLITAHESAKLTQTQDQQLRANAEIELHQARLTTAREVRAWEEQKHRVEVTRQLLSVRSQQQQAEIEFTRLSAQLAELDLQLTQLTEVRAPFAGQIKRIEWEEMNDEKLTVVVYLVAGSR